MNPHDLVRRVSLAARALRARTALRGAQRVGARPRILGTPWIENHGTLTVGDDFTLSSEPITSHLVVGRGATITIGDRVSIGHGAAIAADGRITIEDGVTLGARVMIMDTDFHDVTSMELDGHAVPVRIEAGAKIGEGAVLLKGATLGRGAIVAAGSVVAGAIAAGTQVAGVPARPVRPRTGRREPLDAADVAERVPRIVAETFQVARAVTFEDGPGTLPGWDSLGVLRLLVTLEDELGVPIDAEGLAAARSVGDVVALLS